MKKKRNKGYYYQFWLKTSGQSDHAYVYRFDRELTKEELKEKVEDWTKLHSCTEIAESYTYGWRKISSKQLPKDRNDCLREFSRICRMFNKWKEKRRLIEGLLTCAPYNGDLTFGQEKVES